jgi:hypothetical protein
MRCCPETVRPSSLSARSSLIKSAANYKYLVLRIATAALTIIAHLCEFRHHVLQWTPGTAESVTVKGLSCPTVPVALRCWLQSAAPRRPSSVSSPLAGRAPPRNTRRRGTGRAAGSGGLLSTVNRAHMAYDDGGIKALKPKLNGGCRCQLHRCCEA